MGRIFQARSKPARRPSGTVGLPSIWFVNSQGHHADARDLTRLRFRHTIIF
jgi:hypothetical protein